MKTIEERAKEACKEWAGGELDDDIQDGCFMDGFVVGAMSEREELTRWHDPKVQLPETDVEVLVMVHADGHTYDVMRYDQNGWWQKAPGGGWCAAEHTPIGWRYIHEN